MPPIKLTQEQFDQLKQESKQPYLTEEKFNKFLTNDFFHLAQTVSSMKGTQKVILGLVLAIVGSGIVGGLVALCIRLLS